MFDKADIVYIVKGEVTTPVYNELMRWGSFTDQDRAFLSLLQGTAPEGNSVFMH